MAWHPNGPPPADVIAAVSVGEMGAVRRGPSHSLPRQSRSWGRSRFDEIKVPLGIAITIDPPPPSRRTQPNHTEFQRFSRHGVG